jgi:hypothetical protein
MPRAGLPIILLEADAAGLVERVPLASGIERSDKFRGGAGLGGCGPKLAVHFDSRVPEEFFQMAVRIELSHKLLGTKNHGFCAGSGFDCTGRESFSGFNPSPFDLLLAWILRLRSFPIGLGHSCKCNSQGFRFY